MMKSVQLLVCLMISAIFIMPISAVNDIGDIGIDYPSDSTRISNGGWLEERDGVKILHLSGSNYEMGYQHGALLKHEIQENMRMILDWSEQKGFSYDVILDIWDVMKGYLPQEYLEEMQGMADGSELVFDRIAVYNTWPAVINHVFVTCCGAAVWGSATGDNRLYHIRSLDILHPALEISDPETGTHIRENQFLIVRKPDIGYASITPEFAGAVYSWGGINEQGIAIGAKTCLTDDTTYLGISAAFRMRMALDHADTANKAINIMNSQRTCGWNFIISDGNIPQGFILEQTANLVYAGTWFDPIESIIPFWEMEDVVRRSVMFISPVCAATQLQRGQYDPSGLRGLLLFFMGQNRYFTAWGQYKAMSEQLESQWGTLDLNNSMLLLRDVYQGKSNLPFSLTQKFPLFAFKALHQWVACPDSGDIVISFADDGSDTACDNPLHYFNLFRLLEAEPP